MSIQRRSRDKYHIERKVITDQLKRWRNETVSKTFFYSILDPHIRYTGVLMAESRINFCVVDRMNQHKFYCIYHHKKGKIFEVHVDEEVERLSFLNEKKVKPMCALRKVLEHVLKRYVEVHPPASRPDAKRGTSEMRVDPVARKSLQHYTETWNEFIPRGKMPNPTRRTEMRRLVEKKQMVIMELMSLLKHPLPNCNIRALNTFLWHVDLHAEFFENPFRDILLKENFETIHLQVRFSMGYRDQFPFIRVMDPRLLHDKLSMGGVLTDEFIFKSFRGLLKKLKDRMKFFKVDLSCPPDQQFYDEDLSKTDWKRIEIYTSAQFPTLNRFSKRFQALPPVFHFETPMDAESLEYGNKMILPASALNDIFQANPHPQYPILFEVKSGSSKLFAGVKEFTAKHQQAVIPHWMLRGLGLPNGGEVNIRCVGLPQCSHVKMMPHDASFLRRVKNYKLLLESCLKNFFTLTIGDSIPLLFGGSVFWMYIVELKPENAVSIVASRLGILEMTFEVVPPPFQDSREEFASTLNSQGIPIQMGGQSGEQVTPTSTMTPPRTVDDLVDEVQTPRKVPGVNYVKCENCGHSVNEWSYRRHLPYCQKTYYKCPLCQKVIKLLDKEAHKTEFHTKIQCRKCGQELEKSEIHNHLKNICSRRITHCQYFGCPVPAHELVSHERGCANKTEQCPKCGEMVYMKAKDVHQVSCLYGGTTKDPKFNPRLQMNTQDRQKLMNKEKDLKMLSDYDYQMSKVLEMSLGMEDGNPQQQQQQQPGEGFSTPGRLPPRPGEGGGGGEKEEVVPESPNFRIDGVDYELERALELSLASSPKSTSSEKKEAPKEFPPSQQGGGGGAYGRIFNYSSSSSSSISDPFTTTRPPRQRQSEQEMMEEAIRLSLLQSTGGGGDSGGDDVGSDQTTTTSMTTTTTTTTTTSTDTNDNIMVCPFCKVDVGDEKGLVSHFLDNHIMDSKRVKCPICNTYEDPFYNHICRVHIQ